MEEIMQQDQHLHDTMNNILGLPSTAKEFKCENDDFFIYLIYICIYILVYWKTWMWIVEALGYYIT